MAVRLLPELILLAASCSFFCATLRRPQLGVLQTAAYAAALGALAAAVATSGGSTLLFHGVYKIDAFSQCFKIIICGGLALVLWFGAGLRGVNRGYAAEYHLFLCAGCLGLCIMVSAVELITMILALEVASYGFYVLIPLRDRRSEREPLEAGIKYVFFGGAATAVSLYGLSYLFGMGHSTRLSELARTMPLLVADQPLALVGLVLVVCGICYKLALFPLHFWMPDVFTGAAYETACCIATLPKAASIALVLRFLMLAGPAQHKIALVFGALALLSMLVGNLSALRQQDIKRMLAFSGVAHAGYLMVGMLALNRLGVSAAVYYIAGYMLMTGACFFVLYQIAPVGKNVRVEDLRGLHRRSPLLAATLAVAAVGLAGIPPTIGFTGKFFMLAAAVERQYAVLAAVAILNICVAAFYYLRLVRAAYTGDTGAGAAPVTLSAQATVCAALLIGVILLCGVLPGPLFDALLPAVRALR